MYCLDHVVGVDGIGVHIGQSFWIVDGCFVVGIR